MTAVDDILYAPITDGPALLDQVLIANIALALGDPNRGISFSIDPTVALDTYLRIADIINADKVIFRAARVSVASDPHGNFRPKSALSIKDLFELMHSGGGLNRFFWTAKGSGTGVEFVEFANTFSIVSGMPLCRMADGRDYEWWIVGLMPQFAGYHGFYVFADQAEAKSYWNAP